MQGPRFRLEPHYRNPRLGVLTEHGIDFQQNGGQRSWQTMHVTSASKHGIPRDWHAMLLFVMLVPIVVNVSPVKCRLSLKSHHVEVGPQVR